MTAVSARRPAKEKRPSWSAKHSEILSCSAERFHDREIAAWIEMLTGDRFKPRTVAEHRRALGYPRCRRNDWAHFLHR